MIRSVLFAIAFYVNAAVFLVLGAWLFFAPRSWAMAGLRAHARASLWWLRIICGTRIEVRGREHLPSGPALIAAKHQSAWDTFALIPIFRDPAMVMKAELGLIPFYGWFSHKFRHIFVRRTRGPAALRKLVADAKERAAAGRDIVIFPEGTRRAPGSPPAYKPGASALYAGLGQACVPVALNSGLFWPRRQLRRYPGTIIVQILPPIPPGLDRKTFEAKLIAEVETATAALIDEALSQPNPPPMPRAGNLALPKP